MKLDYEIDTTLSGGTSTCDSSTCHSHAVAADLPNNHGWCHETIMIWQYLLGLDKPSDKHSIISQCRGLAWKLLYRMCRWGLAQMSLDETPSLPACYTIQLRPRATEQQMDFCWKGLHKREGELLKNASLPSELRTYAAGSPALLCHYVQVHCCDLQKSPLAEVIAWSDCNTVVEVRHVYFCFHRPHHSGCSITCRSECKHVE